MKIQQILLLTAGIFFLLPQARGTTMAFASTSATEWYASSPNTFTRVQCSHSGVSSAGCNSSIVSTTSAYSGTASSDASMGSQIDIGGYLVPPQEIALAELHVSSPYYSNTHSISVSASAHIDVDITMMGPGTTGFLQYKCPHQSYGAGTYGSACAPTLSPSITGPSTTYGDQYFQFTYGSLFTFHVDAGSAGVSEDTVVPGGEGGNATLQRIAVYDTDFSLLSTFATPPDANGQFLVIAPEPSTVLLLLAPCLLLLRGAPVPSPVGVLPITVEPRVATFTRSTNSAAQASPSSAITST